MASATQLFYGRTARQRSTVMTARLATQSDPNVQTIESGRAEEKLIWAFEYYYGNIVSLWHIGGYPRLGRIVLNMSPAVESDDLNVARERHRQLPRRVDTTAM